MIDVNAESDAIAAATLSSDKPTLREILASDIKDLCRRVAAEQLEDVKVIDGIRVTTSCSSHGGNVAVFYVDAECPLCNTSDELQQANERMRQISLLVGISTISTNAHDWAVTLMQIRGIADTNIEVEAKMK